MKLSEPMREWNRAVEWCDRLTDFALDHYDAELLHSELQAAGFFGAARQLRIAGTPLGYFKAGEHFPVDKTGNSAVKQQRKAKK